MADSISLKTGSGKPIEEVFIDIEGLVRPRKEDFRLAGEIVKTGIRDRTAKGVDVNGAPFAPYNETRPYYYHVASAGGKFGRFGVPGRRFNRQAERAAVTRLVRKLQAAGRAAGTPLLNSLASKSGTGRTIKFPSYGAFKRAFERGVVDLHGVVAPHMLDAIVVTPEADGVRIGIYDERSATIARGHTTGNRPRGMPLRKFFGVSEGDIRNIKETILEQIRERLRG